MKKWNIGWGTVSMCNMNCQFCYSKYRRKNSKDLGYADWRKFIDENHSMIGTINYGTGENTLDKNWFRLVNYIRSNYPEIRQALTTNGYLSEAIKDEYCMKIFIDAIDEVDVSLDYCDEELHNTFRGQSNAYRWALNTLDLCQMYNKQVTIVFLGSERNINKKNVDGLFGIAKKYDAILRMNMYRPTEGVNEFSNKFIVDYDTFRNILEYISNKHEIISLSDTLFSTLLTGKSIQDPSGCKSIRILADGSITPSTYLIDKEYIVGNISEDNVLVKLENKKLLEGIIERTIPEECSECVYKKSCAGGVFDRRYLWYGTLERKDPYCPGVFTEKIVPTVNVKKTNFHSVHDGYLPTIFFKVKGDE